MKYRVVSHSECRDIVVERLAGRERIVNGTEQGLGKSLDWAPIRRASKRMKDELSQTNQTKRTKRPPGRDPDQIEGRLALDLHAALAGADSEVLDDEGFWRYLALRYFWEVVRWREPRAFGKGWTAALKYVDARNPTDCVLTRMYLRARAVGLNVDAPGGNDDGDGHGDAAHALAKATDFWRSHVLRVRTGTAPDLVRAFVGMQDEDRLPTAPLRELAKALNRTWTNVVLNTYDEQEARALLEELKAEVVERNA